MTGRSREAVVAVLTTAPDEAIGEELARRVIEERLAACANLIPGVVSIYRWQGEVRRESEVQVVFKTTAGLAALLQERLLDWHPYDVPEFVILPIAGGSDSYLEWVRSEVGHTS